MSVSFICNVHDVLIFSFSKEKGSFMLMISYSVTSTLVNSGDLLSSLFKANHFSHPITVACSPTVHGRRTGRTRRPWSWQGWQEPGSLAAPRLSSSAWSAGKPPWAVSWSTAAPAPTPAPGPRSGTGGLHSSTLSTYAWWMPWSPDWMSGSRWGGGPGLRQMLVEAPWLWWQQS